MPNAAKRMVPLSSTLKRASMPPKHKGNKNNTNNDDDHGSNNTSERASEASQLGADRTERGLRLRDNA